MMIPITANPRSTSATSTRACPLIVLITFCFHDLNIESQKVSKNLKIVGYN